MTEPLSVSLVDELKASAARTARSGTPDTEALALLRRSGLCAAWETGESVNRVVEEIATANPSLAIVLFQHCAVAARIAEWGSDAQKETLLPALSSGAVLAASAWSEPGAGAAKKVLATSAVRRAWGWVLDGGKSFTTGAGIADLYLVLVQTAAPGEDTESVYGSAGQSFFLVSGDNPGLVPDLGLDLAGMRGSATGFVTLKDCVVADTDLLGPLGEAPKIIAGVRRTGATLGAVSAGIARAALSLAEDHLARAGKLSSQSVRHQLVDLGVQVEAACSTVARAGSLSSADPGMTTLRSKLFATVVAEHVCLEVARLLSSTGYVVGNRINQLLADARAVALMGPANELCRELVAAPWLR
ncbi:acyl-CoA dehydrogenase [Actinosynnema sp. ALI-1.44]|uniref:acyl-CoA dehydrogenase family protein n=1 Tax=Actinosynnema sp. ALI-1.44 TaxID=1933779 RepID=UPI00097C4661|nr:acyl-CoA dehydrogenase family protein [Actinosynnema sp. ALI-1.44]ONI87881.1 acyl-CoA dehydrogenase [Actinosynnema sp. ALI-1.44]